MSIFEVSNWRKDRVFYTLPKDKLKLDFNQELFDSSYWKDFQKIKCATWDRHRASLADTIMQTIYSLVRKTQPSIIVETGVATGSTTFAFLTALKKNGKGKLISIEPNTNQKNFIMFVPKELQDCWDLRVGLSENILPTVIEPIDIFMHDSLHTYDHMYFEYEWALWNLREGGWILSHDIGHNNSFFDFVKKHNLKWYLVETAAPARFGLGVADVGIDNPKTMFFNLFSFTIAIIK